MNRRELLRRLGLSTLIVGLAFALPLQAGERTRSNVVLIVCDDLNGYVTGFGGHPQARTPHLERLAETAVSFTRAYSNNPICAPSRSSFLTGIYPHTSRNHHFDKWYLNPVLKNCRTLMDYFKQNGYQVVGSGKLMHHLRPAEWTEFKHKHDYGPFWYKGGKRLAHPGVPEPYASIGCVDGSYGALEAVPPADKRAADEGWIYGAWGKKIQYLRLRSGDDRDPTPDERNAAWAAAKIGEFAKGDVDKPFFLGVGFIRPHTPLVVPQKYFDLFPADKVKLPVLKENDGEDAWLKDVVDVNKAKGFLYYRLLKESYGGTLEGLRTFTRAYLASVAAVDDCIGQILEALDKSPFKDNTIVVVTSDHGWNMGQKDWVFKMSLWEESCRVPLIIRAPGVSRAGKQAGHPVSLVDLYPTLADLCGLKGDTRKNEQGAKLDGHSLRPFLEDPENGTWDGPDAALSMIRAGGEHDKIPEMQHYSVRTHHFRYIRYNTGQEELYDHRNDPHEWTNLAEKTEFAEIKAKLRAKLDAMTGLKVGVVPPREATPIEKGEPLKIPFEDFSLETDFTVWPTHHKASITRKAGEVIDGRASLRLQCAGEAWNMATFKAIEIPPGMSCTLSFDCRALEVQEGGFLYYILSRGKTKSQLTKVPLKKGEKKHVTGTVTNDQGMSLPLVIGFHKGGTYVIDNLELIKK